MELLRENARKFVCAKISTNKVLQKILFALASKRVGRARKTFDQIGVALY